MQKINIKPLSVNKAWQGKRFKTPEYKAYENIVYLSLKNQIIPEGRLELHIIVGLSNKLADADNVVKPFQDILQKRFGFNDHRIYKLVVEKDDVKKGEEFIQFVIMSHD